MRKLTGVAMVLALGLLLGLAGPPSAVSAPADRWDVEGKFLVETFTGQKRGRTVVSGYVHNLKYQHARVRLEIEGLDAQGNVVGIQPGFVDNVVPVGSRAYFEVPGVIPSAVTYKAYILWYDWVGESRGDFAQFK
jgi:hypothetical protein